MDNTFLQDCLSVSLLAAKAAGEAVLAVYRGDIDVVYKDDHTPLTVADNRAHTIIANKLSRQMRRRIPILSEEGEHAPYDERKRWDYFWLVDPLDGTKEFIKGREEFTVNIALIAKRRPVLGVVFVPARGLLYFASEGVGSYKLESLETLAQLAAGMENSENPIPLLDAVVRAAKRLPLDFAGHKSGGKVTVVGSRSHGTEALADFVHRMKQGCGEVQFLPTGSALKFLLIAEGKADIYPRFGPTMEWDTAAGQCVVEQSGGIVLALEEGISLAYNKKELRNPDFICRAAHFKNFPYPFP